MSLKIGGIHHDQDSFRSRRVPSTAQKHIPEHGFIWRSRVQAVGSGQVQETYLLPIVEKTFPLLFFHRHARVVTYFLLEPCEGIEKGGLTAVGIAYQSEVRWARYILGQGIVCRRLTHGVLGRANLNLNGFTLPQ